MGRQGPHTAPAAPGPTAAWVDPVPAATLLDLGGPHVLLEVLSPPTVMCVFHLALGIRAKGANRLDHVRLKTD